MSHGEEILKIDVTCLDTITVNGLTCDVVMVPFTGTASGERFSGRIIGTGTDTQTIIPGKGCKLSARYMLEGTDVTGAACKIFIENESAGDGTLRPRIVTDSEALADWEKASLVSGITPREGGVIVRIYREQ